jgi:hypothetical protein
MASNLIQKEEKERRHLHIGSGSDNSIAGRWSRYQKLEPRLKLAMSPRLEKTLPQPSMMNTSFLQTP